MDAGSGICASQCSPVAARDLRGQFPGAIPPDAPTPYLITHPDMATPFEAVSGVANACQILPGVITGGQPTGEQLRAFKAAGGEVVLDLRDPMESRMIDEPALARELGIEYVNVPVRAGSLDDATMERILGALRQSKDRTLFFHCGS